MKNFDDYHGIELAGVVHSVTKKGDLSLIKGKKKGSVRRVNGGLRVKVPGKKAEYLENVSVPGAVRRVRKALHSA